MILLNILQNIAIYLLFCFAHYDNFSKSYLSILQGKLNFLVLHNFTTQEPQLFQIWDWWWNINKNSSFRFRLFPKKLTTKFFKNKKIYIF